jgi:hypothetical protein
MWEIEVTEKTIEQRGGKSPDIQITRTRYIPVPLRSLKRRGKKGEPIDYGVTESQFLSILNKASQPIEKSKQNKKDS